jgi:hypothetical protein
VLTVRLMSQPTLPDGVSALEQLFPVRYGNVSLFFSLSGAAPTPGPPAPPAPPAPGPPSPPKPWSCELFGCNCQLMTDYYGMISHGPSSHLLAGHSFH